MEHVVAMDPNTGERKSTGRLPAPSTEAGILTTAFNLLSGESRPRVLRARRHHRQDDLGNEPRAFCVGGADDVDDQRQAMREYKGRQRPVHVLPSLAGRPNQQHLAGTGFGFDFQLVRTSCDVLRVGIVFGIARQLVAVFRKAVENESPVAARCRIPYYVAGLQLYQYSGNGRRNSVAVRRIRAGGGVGSYKPIQMAGFLRVAFIKGKIRQIRSRVREPPRPHTAIGFHLIRVSFNPCRLCAGTPVAS
jgi:hypothetical protein